MLEANGVLVQDFLLVRKPRADINQHHQTSSSSQEDSKSPTSATGNSVSSEEETHNMEAPETLQSGIGSLPEGLTMPPYQGLNLFPEDADSPVPEDGAMQDDEHPPLRRVHYDYDYDENVESPSNP